ncbi:unnamed protein product [Microthlaspi erraticum]|uniref:CCHC-type domain-containing protein n=1 Tax=Microthlaspi erraticum TaxID=1685480 RepID=A0A6D2IRD0_9BRAS|nr:unnamed protein product [Microthlaspi erraticum]
METPTVTVEGVTTAVPRERWTTAQRDEYKFNARALAQIHGSCSKKQFELIQGCTKSKEAWDILQIHFEGTSQVQSSRKDLLATKFENMRMEEHESIADFSSKLSSLVQESRTLGKLHELELGGVKKAKGIALISTEKQSEEEPEEDSISLLVRRFDRVLKKTESQCHECKGYGHFKTDCPTVKRRSITCYKCKGIGHTQQECEYDEKMGKSMMGVADEDSEGESEDEEEEVRNALVEVGKENIELKKENTRLAARVDELQKALQAEKDLNMDNLNIVLEKMDAVKRADDITKEYFLEKENSRNLQAELDQHRKQLKMLTGTKELDKILSIGRVGKSNLGLGYTADSVTTSKNVKFVSGGLAQGMSIKKILRHQLRNLIPFSKLGIEGRAPWDWDMIRLQLAIRKDFRVQEENIKERSAISFFIRKSDLYQNPARRTSTGGSRHRIYSNMVLLEEIDEADNTGPWYFDSGCSRHMT